MWQSEFLRNTPLDNRNMGQLCKKLPRHAVVILWREALATALERLSAATSDVKVLVCHLTLFSSARREFYVPWRPSDFQLANGEAANVDRVIALIDDVYDMYVRLAGPGELFNEVRQTRNYVGYVEKLTGVNLLDRGASNDEARPPLLSLEVRLKALDSLISWRRAELVQAESLAHSLDNPPLTVLGVKHSTESLRNLLSDRNGRAVYLSHKITEARRYNRDNPNEWPRFVAEVNALSRAYNRHAVVIVHPTAIDELRMTSHSGHIGLGDRWPLQEEEGDLLYVAPLGGDAPQHKELFSDLEFETEATQQSAAARFRAFEISVWHEIAARDHLLVSSSEGLLLYRPVVTTGRDSGGARSEVLHWIKQFETWPYATDPPKLVSLHTFDDIAKSLSLLTDNDRISYRSNLADELVIAGWDPTQAEDLIDGSPLTSLHLDEISGADSPLAELERACGLMLVRLFRERLSNVRLPGAREGAALIARESPRDLRSGEAVKLAVDILRGDARPTDAVTESVNLYRSAVGHDNMTEFALSLIGEP